jgi:fluoride exporter
MGFLIVFLGGGIGAALRHGVNLISARWLGTSFNYATLLENVSGSIVMGLLVGYFAFKSEIPQHWRLFLTTSVATPPSRRSRSIPYCCTNAVSPGSRCYI